MSTTNETFWAGNLKETPLCGVAPQQHRMNTPALVLQHHKKSFPFPYTHKNKVLQEACKLLTNKWNEGKKWREKDRLEEEIGKNGRWRRAEGEIEYDSSKRQKESAKNSVRRYEKKVKGQTKNVLAHRLN